MWERSCHGELIDDFQFSLFLTLSTKNNRFSKDFFLQKTELWKLKSSRNV